MQQPQHASYQQASQHSSGVAHRVAQLYHWGIRAAFGVLALCMLFPTLAAWGVWYLMALPPLACLLVAYQAGHKASSDPPLLRAAALALLGMGVLIVVQVYL